MAKPEDERLASRKIAAVLRSSIKEGQYETGDRLPTARQLAADHGVAINTAASAVRLLQAEGLVEIRGTTGAFVRSRPAGSPDLYGELLDVQQRLDRTRQELAGAAETVATLLEQVTTQNSRDANRSG